MKNKRTSILCAATSLLALGASISSSHAAVVFSNIGTTSGSSSGINTGGGSGKAVNFAMAAGDDYTFDSATVSLSGASAAEL